ncbi:MAG: lasso peptide biosynthesis B2 protein [Bryobacteraceae bacterium]|jgi:hypothetical protein
MSIIRKLRVFWLLAPAERWLTIEALLLSMMIPLGFQLFGVPRTQGWVRNWALIRKKPSALSDATVEIRTARRAQRRVARATGLLGSCLVRSMTLWAMLLRRGLETNLRVGFRKRAGKIQGHAWVEHDAAPVNESESETSTFVVYEQPACFDLWRQSAGSP